MISNEEIRTQWFDKHKAKLTKTDNLTILDWRDPEHSNYYIRFIFDGYKIYISGDMGYAVFLLTWEAEIHSFANMDCGYFASKIKAFDCDVDIINSEMACKQFEEWLHKECLISYELLTDSEKAEIDEIKEDLSQCSTQIRLEEIINFHSKLLLGFDRDYYYSLAHIGETIHPRIRAYLIALQMASEQLKVQNDG